MTQSNRPAYRYQVGGSLRVKAPSYVYRQADDVLYNWLQAGELCYVFNCRQMGKSSLGTQVMDRLLAQKICCVRVDLMNIGTDGVSVAAWYRSIIEALHTDITVVLEAILSEDMKFDWEGWQAQYKSLMQAQDFTPAHCLNQYLKKILLRPFPQQRFAILIDEIDNILNLQFDASDFFGLIRGCFNRRADDSDFERLTFALFGVATPSQLIQNPEKTPFNLGKGVVLTGFELERSLVLAEGLAHAVANPNAVLQQILMWTGGQPFLTQKLCDWIQRGVSEMPPLEAGNEAAWVEQFVQSHIIHNWKLIDEPVHFRTISDSIKREPQKAGRLLGLYQEILKKGYIVADESEAQTKLCLSGLVVRQGEQLKIYNRIYAYVFNLAWVEQELAEIRPEDYTKALKQWLNSDKQEEYLLSDKVLRKVLKELETKRLTDEDYEYIKASQNKQIASQNKQIQEFESTIKELEEKDAKLEASLVAREQAQEQLDLNLAQDRRALRQLRKAQQKLRKNLRLGTVIFIIIAIASTVIITISLFNVQENRAAIALERDGLAALDQFKADQIGALLSAIKTGRTLENKVRDGRSLEKYPTVSPILALQTILFNIQRKNEVNLQMREAQRPRSEYRSDVRSIVKFSPNTKRVIDIENDRSHIQRIDILDPLGKMLHEFWWGKDYEGSPKYLIFGTDGVEIVTYDFSEEEKVATIQTWHFPKQKGPTQKIGEFKTSVADNYRRGAPLFTDVFTDGKLLAIVELNITQIRNLSGEILTQLPVGYDYPRRGCVDFSPDGKLIATISPQKDGEHIVQLWGLSGQKLAEFMTDIGESGKFVPDSNLFLTYGHSGIQAWNIANLDKISPEWLIHEIQPENKIDVLEISADSKKVATLRSKSGELQLLDAKTGKQSSKTRLEDFSLQAHYGAIISFSPDLNQISRAEDHSIELWNLVNPQFTEFKSPDYSLTDSSSRIKSSPDGKKIITKNSLDIYIWNLSGKNIHHFETIFNQASPDQTRDVCIDENSNILTQEADGRFTLCNLSGQRLGRTSGQEWVVNTFADKNWCTRVIFSPNGKRYLIKDGKHLGIRNGQQDVYLKDWGEGVQREFDFDEGSDGLTQLYFPTGFSPDGTQLIMTGYRRLNQWNLSGEPLESILPHRGVRNYKFSPNGHQFATLGGRASCQLKKEGSSEDTSKQDNSKENSPEERCSQMDGAAFLWNLSGRQIATLYENQERVEELHFSADGNRIQTISNDGMIRLWSSSGRLLAKVALDQLRTSYSYPYNSIKFSSDGQRIATKSAYNTILLWSWAGQLLAEFQGNPGDELNDITFSADGKQIFTLWDMEEDRIKERNSDEQPSRYTISSWPVAKVRIFPVKDLDQLLTQGCQWLDDYLRNSPNASNKDRDLCHIPHKLPAASQPSDSDSRLRRR